MVHVPIVDDALLRRQLVDWFLSLADVWKAQADDCKRQADGLTIHGAMARAEQFHLDAIKAAACAASCEANAQQLEQAGRRPR